MSVCDICLNVVIYVEVNMQIAIYFCGIFELQGYLHDSNKETCYTLCQVTLGKSAMWRPLVTSGISHRSQFAECHVADTRQNMDTWHALMLQALPSAALGKAWTRGTGGSVSVLSVTFFFSEHLILTLSKGVAERPIENTRQRPLCQSDIG
jgi:hypothetical protein